MQVATAHKKEIRDLLAIGGLKNTVRVRYISQEIPGKHKYVFHTFDMQKLGAASSIDTALAYVSGLIKGRVLGLAEAKDLKE